MEYPEEFLEKMIRNFQSDQGKKNHDEENENIQLN